jgi:hypothetical protein
MRFYHGGVTPDGWDAMTVGRRSTLVAYMEATVKRGR